MSSMLWPVRARKMAAAVASAPLTPSAWLCVGSALRGALAPGVGAGGMERVGREANGGHAHGRAVAPAVVGVARARGRPTVETAAVAATGIRVVVVVKRIHVVVAVQDTVRHGDGEHRVVG